MPDPTAPVLAAITVDEVLALTAERDRLRAKVAHGEERFEAACKRLDDEAQKRIEWWGERDRLIAQRDAYRDVVEKARMVAEAFRAVPYAGPVGAALRHEFIAAVDSLPPERSDTDA